MKHRTHGTLKAHATFGRRTRARNTDCMGFHNRNSDVSGWPATRVLKRNKHARTYLTTNNPYIRWFSKHVLVRVTLCFVSTQHTFVFSVETKRFLLTEYFMFVCRLCVGIEWRQQRLWQRVCVCVCACVTQCFSTCTCPIIFMFMLFFRNAFADSILWRACVIQWISTCGPRGS